MMGTLDQITQMKQQGMADEAILGALQQQGIPPKEISDALGQAQIKSAVSQEVPQQEMAPPEPGQQEYVQDPNAQQQYYQEAPQQEGYGYGGGATDTETMIEISEQVFADKMQKIEKRVDKEEEFKNIAEVKIENIEQRLQRLEKMFDKLQLEILQKVGTYGKTLQNNKKEMTMMQNSFRKVIGKKPVAKATKKRISKK
jgi:hypothetical protein